MLHLAPANQNSIIKKEFHLVVFEIEVVEVKIKGFSLEYRTVVCIACGTQNLIITSTKHVYKICTEQDVESAPANLSLNQ